MLPVSERVRSGLIPVFVSAVLTLLKGGVALAIGSLAVLASALDSLLDLGASTLNLFSLRKAEQPPDQEHPFGHGKAESLAALFQGLVITGSAVYLLVQSIRRLLRPQPVQEFELGALVMGVSMLAGWWLSRFLVRRAAETGSRLLRTDSLHYAADFWTSGAVVVALGLQRLTGKAWIDPASSLLIGLWILWEVRSVLAGAVDELMDRETSAQERAAIERILHEQAPDILDYHRLRTRRSGPRLTVDVHVVICKERLFEEAHAIVSRLERALRAGVPDADVLVHADPCSSAPARCPGPHRQRLDASGDEAGLEPVFYESVEELPPQLRQDLSPAAQEAYVEAFNREYARSGNPEASAAAAGRRLLPAYVREGERWVKRTAV